MKNIKEFEVKDKRVLLRCDLNVPLDEVGNILDDFRIVKSLPTLQYLMAQQAKIILISHLGKPDGKVVPTLKLDNIQKKLEELLGVSIVKANDCIGEEVKQQVLALEPGHILLLENVRFHKEEEQNDMAFAKELASLGDLYVNDAFSDCHRAHASIVSLPTLLPSAAGLLLQEEIDNLTKILKNPEKPMVAIVGGIKVDTKAKFIESISKLADTVIVSGLIKKEMLEEKIAFTHLEKIIAPVDELEAPDISKKTITLFKEKILPAKTIVWNGPFGKYEDEQYKTGTLEIAKAIVESKAFSVIGGGETIEFLRQEGMIEKFSYVSTGGGAMLDFLTGEELPGLKALE